MKYRIGYRTIKTAVGTSISIMIAQMLQLDNFVSAGILTILCIKSQRKNHSGLHGTDFCLSAGNGVFIFVF